MPESPRMVPLYAARVEDLRVDRRVSVRCRECGHVAEVPVIEIRDKLALYRPVLGMEDRFKCRQCGAKKAEVDARRALGFYG